MKKSKKINKRIPSYKFGAQQIGDLANAVSSAAPSAANLFAGIGNKDADALGGAMSGLSMGASLGSVAGPIGAGIGAVVGGIGGAIVGSIGKKGSYDPLTGEVEYGSGIKGRRGLSDDELDQISANIKNNIANKQNSSAYAEDYYSEHGYNSINQVAEGGIIPNTLAYLDDGELIRTPDGFISQIPEENKPEDSNLMNVPVGTQVLSDKIKVPGTNRTFAEEGKRIMKSKKYGKDKYAQNSKMLNDMNNQIKYDELLAMQESMKSNKKKNIKRYANGTPYLDLDILTPTYTGRFSPENIGTAFKPETKTATQLGYESALQNNKKTMNFNPYDFLSSLTSAASAITAANQNLKVKPESVPTFSYTPKFGPTSYNIDPLLQEINRNNAIARYNQSQLGGAGLAYGIQAAIARDKAVAQAYDTKNKAENQMAWNNSNVYNQWAQFDANARHTADTENAQNRANARNIRRTGISQISTIVPSFLKDIRLENRDKAMFNAMLPYLEYGMTQDTISNLMKRFG